MDTISQGLPQVICYLDDILITYKSDAGHMANLETVLKQLKEQGVQLNKDKCQFFEDAVEYLGHRVNAQGVHTSAKRLKAILEAPKPQNVQDLRSFLGLIMANFCPTWQPCSILSMCSFTMANHGDGHKDALGHSRKLNVTSQKHLSWFI